MTAAGQDCSWRESELLPQLHYPFFTLCFLFCFGCGNILAGYFLDTSRGSKGELLQAKLSLPSPPFQNQTRTFSWYILASRTFGRSNKTLFTERENFGGLHCFKTPGDHVGQFLGGIIEHVHNHLCGSQNSTNPQETMPFWAACRVEFHTPHSSVSYWQKTLL